MAEAGSASEAECATQAEPGNAQYQRTLTDEQISALASPSNARSSKSSGNALQGSASSKLLQKTTSKVSSKAQEATAAGQSEATAFNVEAPVATSQPDSGTSKSAVVKKVVRKPAAKPPPANAALGTGNSVEASPNAAQAADADAAPVAVAASKAATKPKAASKSVSADAAEQTAAAPAPRSKPPVAKKPLPKVLVAAASSTVVPAVPAAAAVAAASPAVSSHVGHSSHGSSTSRRLQALLAEGSAVCLMDAVLSAEGSELPGSRPPAQLHGALDGNGGEVDKEEEQEIQKIISEIHGGGDDDSEEDSEPPRASLSSATGAVAAHPNAPAAASSPAVSAAPASLMVAQQQPAEYVVVHGEQSAAAAAAAESSRPADECATADGYDPQAAEEAGSRASPWPDEEQIKRELLQPDSSSGAGAIVHNNAAATAAGSLTARSAAAAAAAALAAAVHRASATGVLLESNEQTGYGIAGGIHPAYASDGDLLGADDERSRAIAEQLAQLHEESRRLQLQSQVLQQRAIEMSLQMVAESGPVNPSQHHQDLNSLLAPPHHTQHASNPIVQLSHVSNLGNLNPMLDPGSESLAHLPGGSGDLVEADALGLGVRGLPRRLPGDSTPSSVTSSRAGLHWSLPSRSGIPSPGKADSRSYSPVPISAGSYGSPAVGSRPTPRSHSYMQADPSRNYQMYSYNNNSSRESAGSSGVDGASVTLPYMQQQPQQPQTHHHQQQQQQQQHLHHPSYDVDAAAAAAPPPMLPAPQLTSRSGEAAANAGMNRKQRSVNGGASHNGGGQRTGQTNAPLVRKLPLPFKATAGVTTRVAAAGATAGRRSSCDAARATVDDAPAMGTFAAAHAVHGAAGAAVKSGGGRLSPRTGAAVDAAGVAAKQAGSGNKGKAAAAAGAAGGVLHSSSSGPTAAALAAAAAAAGSSGRFNSHVPAAAAVPWGTLGPYAGALYGPYAAMNPAAIANPQAMIAMMMKQQQQQHSSNNKAGKSIAAKLNPATAAGPWMPGMPMAVPPGFMPPGMSVQGSLSAPGGKGSGSKRSGVYGGTAGNYGGSGAAANTGKGGSTVHETAVTGSAMATPAMMLPFGMPLMPGMAPFMNMAAQMPPVSYGLYAGKGQGGTGSHNKGVKTAAAALGLAALPPGCMPAGPWGMPSMAAPVIFNGSGAAGTMQQQQGEGKAGRARAAKGGSSGGKSGWAN